MTNQPAAPAYEVLVSYPVFSMPTHDQTIIRLAKQYGGFDYGSGAGFGERDLVFIFPLFNAHLIAFMSACLPLPGVRVQIKQTAAPLSGSLGIQS
ncbi:MAG TPA: hypothetical protein V6C65_40270 [Allocoleopsis sp.]